MPFPHMEPPVFRNRIIRSLPPEELRLLRPLMTRTRLVRAQVIYGIGERIDQLHFVEEGIISMAPPAREAKDQVEVDYVGRQSALGVTAILNIHAVSFHRTIVQMPGIAYQISARSAHDYLPRLPAFRRLLMEELETSCARLSQNTACRAMHTLTQRLARWLVMARDLADSNTLNVTQEMLAAMLAVRRPGVTVALGRLEQQGFVKHRRGNVIICDRADMAAVACDCDALLLDYTTSLRLGRPVPPQAANNGVQKHVCP